MSGILKNSLRLNLIISRIHKKYLWSNKNKYVHTTNLYATNKRLEHQQTQLRSFIFTRYLNYVKNYNKVLDKKFPTAMKVYRIFMVGTKEFLLDLKEFLKIVKIVNTSETGIRSLNRKQIELYHQMPKDMVRVAPVLLLSAIPLSNYVIFPLAYFFPRVLLTSHFWSIQQRSDFAILKLTKKLTHYKPVFRCIQEKLPNIEPNDLHSQWAEVIALLGSGQQPTPQQILNCRTLFEEDQVYNLYKLKSYHLKELLRMHGLHGGLFRRKRLNDLAKILNEMDLAIEREGGTSQLTMDTLKNACFLRGLNATNLSQQCMIEWLNQWITISKEINLNNVSLLLHCPVLLAYNQPSNWMLIYNNRYNEV